MLTVLAIGDPHFKINNVRETNEMTDKLIICAKKLKPDFIVCLGDVLDTHETIHESPLRRANLMLKQLSEVAPLYLIIGNHDRPNNSDFLSDRHPFVPLKYWPNTTVVDKTISETIKGFKFVFVPYVPPGKFENALNKIDNPLEDTCCIFAHQEFYGAKMGAICSEIGDKWPVSNPLVISGHIHDYDKLQSNLIYTGTPMQHGFGDLSNKTISSYVFTSEGFTESRIDLDLTRKITVYVSTEEFINYELPSLNKIKLKLVIKGTTPEIKTIMKLEKVKLFQKRGVKISYNQIKDKLSVIKNQHMITKSYLELLREKIYPDKRQLKWFQELFK